MVQEPFWDGTLAVPHFMPNTDLSPMGPVEILIPRKDLAEVFETDEVAA